MGASTTARVVRHCCVVAALASFAITPVFADQPIITRSSYTAIEPFLSSTCGFQVEVHAETDFISHESAGVTSTIQHLLTSLTNLDTGTQVISRFSGRVSNEVDLDAYTLLSVVVGAKWFGVHGVLTDVSAGMIAVLLDFDTGEPLDIRITGVHPDTVYTIDDLCWLLSQ